MCGVAVFPFIFCVFALSLAVQQCSWVIDIVERNQTRRAVSTILPKGNYFLRIRVQCNGKVSYSVSTRYIGTWMPPSLRSLLNLKFAFIITDQLGDDEKCSINRSYPPGSCWNKVLWCGSVPFRRGCTSIVRSSGRNDKSQLWLCEAYTRHRILQVSEIIGFHHLMSRITRGNCALNSKSLQFRSQLTYNPLC